MRVRHEIVTLNDSSGTELPANQSDEVKYSVTFSIQNVSESANVFIGASNVSSSSYGLKLIPGAIASFDSMARNSEIYAISDEGSSSVAVLQVIA
jgi:hypothetical protein